MSRGWAPILQGNFRSRPTHRLHTGKLLICIRLGGRLPGAIHATGNRPCKTRPSAGRRVLLLCLLLLPATLQAQVREGDDALGPTVRRGLTLAWDGKLDSALAYLARARASDPRDPEIRVIEARVMAWNKQYSAALLRYDSLLAENPSSHDALVGRAQTLAWSGQRSQALREYGRLLDRDSTDREALLGSAQVHAWQGTLGLAERQNGSVLARKSNDVDARVGLGYVYLWQGRAGAAGRQARYVLAIDSTHKGARELRRLARQANHSAVESSASWGNDSDENTGFWQSLDGSAGVRDGLTLFGSVNALEASDPVREATRVGGEAGLTMTSGALQISGAAGARRLTPEVSPGRTAETYRAALRVRPSAHWGTSLGYARLPFDEIASLFERRLDMELLEGGIDVRPLSTLRIAAGGGGLWLSDGNRRTSVSLGLTQTIRRRFFVGVFGRALGYERRGIGYFSPDRFSVLEGNAGYNLESRTWAGSLSGGLGAQQVGKGGAAQTEWHLEGRLGPRWGDANRIELFGLITNSAVSSTTGAFRYRSAGISLKLGL
jgi:tetratricopeptide (TPR) repeat protein